MGVTRKILKWLIIIIVILFIQTTTFLTIGPGQLSKHLFPLNYIPDKHVSDSAFVRDYYTTDCTTGDVYIVNHKLSLKSKETFLKEKLGVKSIHFANQQTSNWTDTLPNSYNLYYETYAKSKDWPSLYGFFDCRVDERVIINQNQVYFRRTQYRWFLLFWIQTFEYRENYELHNQLETKKIK